ncbi:contact-dependent growth inhibition system immunity protein [Paraburkholderia ferrariae]|uniref:contact-dependent growth inhibition system immunity protein n=1 Tax=Paraburkholderia ferrariae TaxID=386056 RepID=UPI001FE130E2|nr:contact-dependent growth inhibition system immunity protein [Paraburkholderia ferrariae]
MSDWHAKMTDEKYENLEQLIFGRFHEDFDLFGDTIQELVLSYKEGRSKDEVDATISEIDAFKIHNPDDLDAAFKDEFGYQCNPRLWGHTAASFLDELKRLLSE